MRNTFDLHVYTAVCKHIVGVYAYSPISEVG